MTEQKPDQQNTPINATFAQASMILAGGDIRGGAVYGESDKHGAFVVDRPVRPQDLGATIFRSLGVPLNLRLGRDGFTRPLSTGEPLFDLFG